MAKDMNPPFSESVVSVADEQVEAFTALGWSPVDSESKSAPRKTADKK